jgi:hypothetical protein
MNTNYEKDFVPYEEALELKKLGFDEPCFAVYIDKTLIIEDDWLYSTNQDTFIESSNFTAPLYSQAFRWFRDKYGLKISFPYWNGFNKMIPEDLGRDKYEIMIIPANHRTISVRNPKGRIWFDTYEEAELACLKKLIEIVKNTQKMKFL